MLYVSTEKLPAAADCDQCGEGASHTRYGTENMNNFRYMFPGGDGPCEAASSFGHYLSTESDMQGEVTGLRLATMTPP